LDIVRGGGGGVWKTCIDRELLCYMFVLGCESAIDKDLRVRNPNYPALPSTMTLDFNVVRLLIHYMSVLDVIFNYDQNQPPART